MRRERRTFTERRSNVSRGKRGEEEKRIHDEMKKRENEVEEAFNDSWTHSGDIWGPSVIQTCTNIYTDSVEHMQTCIQVWLFLSSLREVKPVALNVCVRNESNGFMAVVFPLRSLKMRLGTDFCSTNICFLLFLSCKSHNNQQPSTLTESLIRSPFARTPDSAPVT